MSRPVSLRDIDLSRLGPDSPLRQLIRRAPRRDLEHQQQVRLFEWAADNEARYPALRRLFAVPNWIGVRTAKQGARLKAEGRKPGVPDVWLPVARGKYHGLVIELKVGKNRPTPEQADWLGHLATEGWYVSVAFGAAEAIRAIERYLGNVAVCISGTHHEETQ